MSPPAWTLRDRQILEALTVRVRLLTLGQLARAWWRPNGRSEQHAARRLHRLTASGLLESYQVNVHPILAPAAPVFRWSPGGDEPDCRKVSEQLRGRWTEPARPTRVYCASGLAANLFGSSAGRLPHLTHRDHDLLLGDVYLLYLREDPEAAARWVGEDARPKGGYRIKDPDALLLDGRGAVVRVVESGGRYSPEQVEAFHGHCVEHELPYEIW